ncbi:MAG: hypothetical protein WDW36_003062 [Sanguina aurantia]
MPGQTDVFEQIKISNLSMPIYAILPMVVEMAAEKGWTMAYPRVDNVGIPAYLLYFTLYMLSIKWAYKALHHVHHAYNKEHTLSPFAGLAFHPVDGILQALPYAWSLFFIPTHFLTHEILLFVTGIWTTNIHDCLHGKVWPVMGAGYHTIHHTTYKHNYGHYFIFMDQMFGTLESPEEHEEIAEQRTAKAQ